MYSQFIAGKVKTWQLFHFNSFTLQSNSYHKSNLLKRFYPNSCWFDKKNKVFFLELFSSTFWDDGRKFRCQVRRLLSITCYHTTTKIISWKQISSCCEISNVRHQNFRLQQKVFWCKRHSHILYEGEFS